MPFLISPNKPDNIKKCDWKGNWLADLGISIEKPLNNWSANYYSYLFTFDYSFIPLLFLNFTRRSIEIISLKLRQWDFYFI